MVCSKRIKKTDFYFRAILIFDFKYFFAFIISVLFLFSCNRIKKEVHKVASTTTKRIAERKSNLRDKIIAHYDPYHSDTKFNKKRFSEFFKFYPTPDIKNIFCYADEMGIDHSYQFSFTCDSSAINKIVTNLKLNRGVIDGNNGSGFWQNFPWWDSSKIEKLEPFSKKEEHESYSYLWYDSSNKKAYYFSFDM